MLRVLLIDVTSFCTCSICGCLCFQTRALKKLTLLPSFLHVLASPEMIICSVVRLIWAFSSRSETSQAAVSKILSSKRWRRAANSWTWEMTRPISLTSFFTAHNLWGNSSMSVCKSTIALPGWISKLFFFGDLLLLIGRNIFFGTFTFFGLRLPFRCILKWLGLHVVCFLTMPLLRGCSFKQKLDPVCWINGALIQP